MLIFELLDVGLIPLNQFLYFLVLELQFRLQILRLRLLVKLLTQRHFCEFINFADVLCKHVLVVEVYI